MNEYEIETIPLISEMGAPPTLGDTDNFDQDAEAYLYSQRQAFLDLNATIAVMNPVAAAIMQQAQAVASNTSSVQQLADQVSQQANQVSQDTTTVNQQAQTVADLRQQVAEGLATTQEHVTAAQQQAELAEQAAQLAIQVAEFDPNEYYDKTAADAQFYSHSEVEQLIKQSKPLFDIGIFGGH